MAPKSPHDRANMESVAPAVDGPTLFVRDFAAKTLLLLLVSRPRMAAARREGEEDLPRKRRRSGSLVEKIITTQINGNYG